MRTVKRVKLNNELSEKHKTGLGVPQGSVLEPLIFLMYINELPNFLTSECTVLYADDESVCLAADTPDELKAKVHVVLKQFTQWCLRNRLVLNTQKTFCIEFRNRKRFPVFTILQTSKGGHQNPYSVRISTIT